MYIEVSVGRNTGMTTMLHYIVSWYALTGVKKCSLSADKRTNNTCVRPANKNRQFPSLQFTFLYRQLPTCKKIGGNAVCVCFFLKKLVHVVELGQRRCLLSPMNELSQEQAGVTVAGAS